MTLARASFFQNTLSLSEFLNVTADVNRMTIRFSPEDIAWIAEHAEDEGVDNATMVRMLINRLRRGRLPLMSMMEAPHAVERLHTLVEQAGVAPGQTIYVPEGSTAEEVLAARLAEVEQTSAQVVQFPEEESAAMPIRRVDRQRWNPRPK